MILDLAFLTYFFSFIAVSVFILTSNKLGLTRFSVISIIFASLFLFSYLGLLPLYFKWDSYRVSLGVNDREQVFLVLIFASTAILLATITYAFLNKLIPISNNFYCSQLENDSFLIKLLSILLFILSFVFLFLYLSKIKEVALIELINGSNKNILKIRSDMTNNFLGKYHWYKLFMIELLQIVSFIFFARLLAKKSLLAAVLFFISFIAAAFSLTMTTEKAPFIYYLAGLFITSSLTLNNGKIPIFKTLVAILCFLFILFFFHMSLNKSLDITSSVKLTFSRLFTGSASPLYFYLDYLKSGKDLIYGFSFPNPRNILPHIPVSISQEIMAWKFPEEFKAGIVGSMPAAFWSEGLLNFGTLGVVVFSILGGALFYFIDLLISFFPKSPHYIGFVSWVFIHYKDVGYAYLSSFIFDFYFIICGLLLLFPLVLRINFKISYDPQTAFHTPPPN